MQYHVAEVERFAEAGETASPLMSHEASVAVMTAMDQIRAAIGSPIPDE